MAFDWGPDSVVRMPGPRDKAESRDVAKVRVTNGRDGDDGDGGEPARGGR